MSKCIWPTGEHYWSLPQPDGTQTCLWCSAEQQAKPPIDGCTESNCTRCRTHPDRFPKSLNLGGNITAWVESEVDAWLEAQLAAREGGVADAA